ncbi:hypothetical protein SLEP1_g45298 [Rubroshorea leprosula]|uniref:Uncharacterized protein n=1 Tax=Rubroshorea leprosula TaxID=152421 RepID=A0AAV5LJE1_9ROSI|nr:hypothetical protein SLEP1_g45298 [Rubroshorea leprosula]
MKYMEQNKSFDPKHQDFFCSPQPIPIKLFFYIVLS